MKKPMLLILCLMGVGAIPLPAQLAITEVMADSSKVSTSSFQGPDFFELTNLGDVPVNLDGYTFSDNNTNKRIWEPFAGLVIKGHESIIICRTNNSVDTVEEFITWWGANRLPADLRLRFFAVPGFDGTSGDQVWLWDARSNLVDMVEFGGSQPGRSKTYDPLTGVFGIDSEPDRPDTVRAELVPTDIGSPGTTSGAVPLKFIRQPESQVVDCCLEVTFSALGGGLPRPKYQWTSNNIPIYGAAFPTLTLSISPDSTGEFRVVIWNGIDELTSEPASLIVNTNPLKPVFIVPLADTALFRGQSVTLSPSIRGYPLPQFQWYSNAVPIIDATNRQFTLRAAMDAPFTTTRYTVSISNFLGRAESAANVSVISRPKLQITEIMSTPDNTGPHKPWFELSNNGDDDVDLFGYLFRDDAAPSVASRITNHVVIHAGESIIFVDSMTPEAFIEWWGRDLLPRHLQIVTWYGWSVSSKGADVIHLWNPHWRDPFDTVATATHVAAIAGVSEELVNFCDDLDGCAGFFDRDSALGENGAFLATDGNDIGSPGYTSNPPPAFLDITRHGPTLDLRCRVSRGRTYQLFYKNLPSDPQWTSITTQTAAGFVLELTVPWEGRTTRFYQLVEVP